MSILSNKDLNSSISFDKNQWDKSRQILIQNGDKDHINSMGYDLRVGETCFDGTVQNKPRKTNEGVNIKPGDLVLIRTLEVVTMPSYGDISGLILSKVTLVARGLSNVSTKVDPGWSGKLLISIHNVSKKTIKLKHGDEFCTLIFITNKSPCTNLYDVSQKEDRYIDAYAEGQKDYFWLELLINLLSTGLIVGSSFWIGFKIFENTAGFGVIVTIGVVVSNVIQKLVDKYLYEIIEKFEK